MRFFASTMKDDLRYTPSDCFETFPFPDTWESSAVLEAVGREYHDARAVLMEQNTEGLTTTYNRFHDRDDESVGAPQLRTLHASLDRAVLDAYGWADLKATCEYLLEHPADPDDEGESAALAPRRYRWPDRLRDEVLARLWELNRRKALEGRSA